MASVAPFPAAAPPAPDAPAADTLAPETWYAATAHPAPRREPLSGAVEVDACVVGGGISGCSAALHLARAGVSVRLVEAERIGHGASGRNGGQVLPGYGGDLGRLRLRLEEARALWDISQEAVDLVRRLVRTHDIACDLAEGCAEVALTPRQASALQQAARELSVLGDSSIRWLDTEATREAIGSSLYVGALYMPRAAHLHPLNYTLGLAQAAEDAGARLHEDTPLIALDPVGDRMQVTTPDGVITARHVLLCGNAYLAGSPLFRAVRRTIMPMSTHIIATEPLGAERARRLIRHNWAIADVRTVLDYFRLTPDHRLLFGGGGSYTGRPGRHFQDRLRDRMVTVFPELADVAITHGWSGQVAITRNRLPHFGHQGPGVLFVQGYSGHGVAMATLAGRLMAQVVQGGSRAFDRIATLPHQSFPGGPWLRTPLLVAGMTWARLKDRLER